MMGILRGFTGLLDVKQGTRKLSPDELEVAYPAGPFPLFFGDAYATVMSDCRPRST